MQLLFRNKNAMNGLYLPMNGLIIRLKKDWKHWVNYKYKKAGN